MGRGRGGRESQADSKPSREPDTELDHITLRSLLELKPISRFYLLIYLFDTERAGGAGGRGRTGLPLSREQDAGLDPRALRSLPEPKAGAEPTAALVGSGMCFSIHWNYQLSIHVT